MQRRRREGHQRISVGLKKEMIKQRREINKVEAVVPRESLDQRHLQRLLRQQLQNQPIEFLQFAVRQIETLSCNYVRLKT
jgi:hypothetical protein